MSTQGSLLRYIDREGKGYSPMTYKTLLAGSGQGDTIQCLGYYCGQLKKDIRSCDLENNQALESFLASIERRAFRIAQIATNNSDDAFDIVQDAMFKLVEKYANKGEDEWGALFHRILQSRIRDWYRRNTVRNRFRVWLGTGSDGGDEDPIQTAKDIAGRSPEQELYIGRSIEVLEQALRELPLRQQQAFLLRAWEGLDVKQTAAAMACAEGSVKTHYSRALQALRAKLEGHWE